MLLRHICNGTKNKVNIGNVCRLNAFTRQILSHRRMSSVTPFKLADIGEGIAEVELMKWFVKPGDPIKAFDRICEVQSDKATVEITSRYDGLIQNVLHEEGAIVKVGATLVEILVSGAAAGKVDNDPKPVLHGGTSATTPMKSQDSSHAATTVNRSGNLVDSSIGIVQTTPAVRKLAKENGIALESVQGSGPKGRVVKEDILAYIHSGGRQSTPVPQQQQQLQPPIINSPPKVLTLVDRKVPIRGVQRMMVKSMNAALAVQHLTYHEEIVVDQLIQLRKDLKVDIEKYGVKLSFMPLIVKATSLALSNFPTLNATVSSDVSEMTYHANHNIGIAMDTPKGLVVPVLKGVQSKSILEIAIELAALQQAALNGTITEAQLSGGTFTLSNIGSIGGTYAVPVIVVPQVAIGAFGRQQIVPRYIDPSSNQAAAASVIHSGKAEVRPVTLMNVSWSADHRVVDGATVAKFSNSWKAYLENPSLMFSQLR